MDCAEVGRRVCSAITKSQCHRKGLFHDEPAKRCFIQISPIYLTKATSGQLVVGAAHTVPQLSIVLSALSVSTLPNAR